LARLSRRRKKGKKRKEGKGEVGTKGGKKT
jgi:hypothetical protein